MTLDRPGVFDYCCLAREIAGMLGSPVVGWPEDPGWDDLARSAQRGNLSQRILGDRRIDIRSAT
jgi:hypothetical protein